jgi:hypothetical protein
MRVPVLLALAALTLAACDSPYGKTPEYVSASDGVSTGSHLRASPDNAGSGNVQVQGAGSLEKTQQQRVGVNGFGG